MHPQSTPRNLRVLSLFLAGVLVAPAVAPAQQQDAPPVNVGELLKSLKTMREQQIVGVRSQKLAAYQKISAAAGSNEAATALWEEAIRMTQMEGAGKEGALFRAWKEGEGEAFNEREVQFAVRLHLQWMALTLKRSGGVSIKDLMPEVIRYTQDLLGDEIGMENLLDSIKRDKEQGDKNQKKAQKSRDDASMKRVHDQILNRSVKNSVVSQYMKLASLLDAEGWEMTPGNYDGIYSSILLPEMRAQKDVRIFEYWDGKLKREAEAATKSKLMFEVDRFNTVRRPILLWNRTQEFVNLGQKNRAATEMYNLIKAFPLHPDADTWIAALEALVAPPAPALPGTPAAPATPVVPPTTATPTSPAPTAAVPGTPRTPGL
jgi:hypothetical protein